MNFYQLPPLNEMEPKALERVISRLKQKKLIALIALISALVTIKARNRNEPVLVPHRRNSAVARADGAKELYVEHNGKNAKVIIYPTRQVIFESHRRLFLGRHGETLVPVKGQVGLNRKFLAQFEAIWAIIVPRWRSKEAGLLTLNMAFLMLRTWLSLFVARLDGKIVRDIVSANGKGFVNGLVLWFAVSVPAAYTNSMIRHLQSKISLSFRTRLTRYIHDLYVNDSLAYYKITNLDGGIEGVDQFITADVTRFCDAVAALYSNIGKPFMDLAVFNYQLARSLGPVAFSVLLANYLCTAWLLRSISPAFGKLTAKEAKLEGDFRNAHTRLITNAEEIAFYNGSDRERGILNRAFRNLSLHLNHIYRIKIAYNMFEDLTVKYLWSAIGYLVTSLPVFMPSLGGLAAAVELEANPGASKQSDRMRGFIVNRRLMLALADAGGRMMYSIKDLAELAGLTSRVYSLISTLHRVHANAYLAKSGERTEIYSLANVKGSVYFGFNGVRLEGVPIIAPALKNQGGELLINPIDMDVREGNHVLISGSNGVGKSAIARVLATLWPGCRGLISRPKVEDIHFIPQRPYFSAGTLREQILYPHSHADMIAEERSDEELMDILQKVKLDYIPFRDGGWEEKKEWKDTWSGGEKQRMLFARMLYHSPKYAIIDEATSAVSSDIEGTLYTTAKAYGITLITISHRPSLLKYHKYHLILGTGDSGRQWEYSMIGTAKERSTVRNEIQHIEEELSHAVEWQARRDEIEKELTM